MKMEVPRLQIVWTKDNKGKEFTATYELVLYEGEECMSDVRANDEDGSPTAGIVKVNMGETKCSGGNIPFSYGGDKLETPFRDGVHIMRDSIRLGNLPMYVVYGERVEVVEQLLVEVDGEYVNKKHLQEA